jgi:hypothetical protein
MVAINNGFPVVSLENETIKKVRTSEETLNDLITEKALLRRAFLLDGSIYEFSGNSMFSLFKYSASLLVERGKSNRCSNYKSHKTAH